MTDTADGGNGGNGVLGSYRWNVDDQSPSLAIVAALADLQDAGPSSLDALYNSIDPDALDALLRHDRGEKVVVEFRRGDYLIAVSDDGEIRIRDAEEAEE